MQLKIPDDVLEQIDDQRGPISRKRYVVWLLQNALERQTAPTRRPVTGTGTSHGTIQYEVR